MTSEISGINYLRSFGLITKQNRRKEKFSKQKQKPEKGERNNKALNGGKCQFHLAFVSLLLLLLPILKKI